MLALLNRHEINDARWNALVDASTAPLPYAYTWYLDATAPGWNALVEGDYEHAMPLTIGKKLGVNYLYQPYFTQQLGIFSKSPVNEETTQAFLEEIKKRFSFVQIHFHFNHQPPTSTSGQAVSQSDFRFTPRVTFHLSLDKSYEEINAAYRPTLRKNIRIVLNKNLTVTRGESSDWLIGEFKKAKGTEVNELNDADYARLRKLIATAVQKNCGDVYTVFQDSEEVASSFMLRNHRFVIPLFSTSTATGRAMNAMSLLKDHVIRRHSNSNMIFDFEGSQIPSIAAFNRSFGAVPVTYWMLYRNALPWHARMLKQLKDAL